MVARVSTTTVLNRGYMWCSPSCACTVCLYADDWIVLLRDYPGLSHFGPLTDQKIPAPAEFRGGLREKGP